MKTLITLIFCLFVVNTANAEDKWEYLEIQFKHSIISPESNMHSYYVQGNYKGIYYQDGWTEFFNPNQHKTRSFLLLDSTIEEHKKVFGKGIPKFKQLIQYLNFYGDFGFEIVSTVKKRTDDSNEDKFSVFLKRKTN